MTYLGFLIVFMLPPIAILTIMTRHLRLRGAQMPFGRGLALIAGIAFVYTTPWDNYLVYSGVWTYGNDRVIGTLFWVPVEEYAFFLLQPVLTALWTRFLLARTDTPGRDRHRRGYPLWSGWALATLVGWILLGFGPESTRYLGLILGWASPVICALSIYAYRTIYRFGRVVLLGIAAPTVYLWVADALAIANGVWTIESPTSLGWVVLGLPVEEALFFLVTNILVTVGLLTFLYGPGRTEMRRRA